MPTPENTYRLWTLYQENGSAVTGVTDLTVTVTDHLDNILLSETSLTESGVAGNYLYDWDIGGQSVDQKIKMMYKKGDLYLFGEEDVLNEAIDVEEAEGGEI